MDAVTVAGKRNAKREGTCFSIVICLYACSNYAKQVLVASEIPKTVELALLDEWSVEKIESYCNCMVHYLGCLAKHNSYALAFY